MKKEDELIKEISYLEIDIIFTLTRMRTLIITSLTDGCEIKLQK